MSVAEDVQLCAPLCCNCLKSLAARAESDLNFNSLNMQDIASRQQFDHRSVFLSEDLLLLLLLLLMMMMVLKIYQSGDMRAYSVRDVATHSIWENWRQTSLGNFPRDIPFRQKFPLLQT